MTDVHSPRYCLRCHKDRLVQTYNLLVDLLDDYVCVEHVGEGSQPDCETCTLRRDAARILEDIPTLLGDEITSGHTNRAGWPTTGGEFMTRNHGPGEATVLSYPGGKDGLVRVPCVADGCDYSATATTEQRAANRVREHARGKHAHEEGL